MSSGADDDAQTRTHLLLELGVLLLGVNEVENDVEGAGEDEGEEEAEAGQVRIALRAARRVRCQQWRGRGLERAH